MEKLIDQEIEYALHSLSVILLDMKKKSGKTYMQIADESGFRSVSTVQRYCDPDFPENISVKTLMRIANAFGHRVKIEFGELP